MARRYRELLDEIHPAVLRQEITESEGRRQRFEALFAQAGVRPRRGEVRAAMRTARAAYEANHRTVPGARGLLRALRPRWVIVVVSNHLRREQEAKLEVLGLPGEVDALVTSEDAGAAKPDPRPFLQALEVAGVRRQRAVVLGDSWASDVMGAQASGIRSVWLNRYHDPAPEPGVAELPSLVPIARALAAIRRTAASPAR
jgi:HAD superfamily hydrolase (TIGR01509 family)